MPELVKDPILTVRDALVAGWNPANTSGVTPKIHSGWFNQNWKQAQVTVTDLREFPSGGGSTGFRAIDSLGNGVKLMLGTMTVAVWAHDGDQTGINPLQLSFEMSEEVKRIIKANMIPDLGTTGLNWLSWLGRRRVVDTSAEPITFRYENTVSLMYEDRV